MSLLLLLVLACVPEVSTTVDCGAPHDAFVLTEGDRIGLQCDTGHPVLDAWGVDADAAGEEYALLRCTCADH